MQTALRWHEPAANRARFEALLAGCEGSDLIVLPEMFTTGFTMEAAANAERMDGPTVRWMAAMAERHGAAVCGSLIVGEGGAHYNRLVWMRPDGDFSTYDKRHLFAMAGEDRHYRAGTRRLVVDMAGLRVCPLICYDLRFPVWSRNRGDYDVLLYVANWPSPRRAAWRALLAARAIENQCYAIGVNRIGEDDNGHVYAGDSLACDFLGATLLDCAADERVTQVTLDPAALAAARERLPFLRDADAFTLGDR